MLYTATPVSVVVHQGSTGPIINFIPASGKSIISPASVRPLPPMLLASGFRVRISLSLNVSCVAAPIPSFSFMVMLGSVVAFTTGPIPTLGVQYINAECRVRMDIRVDSAGSPNKGVLIGDAAIIGPMFGPYPAPPVPPTGAYGSLGLNQPLPRLAGRSGWLLPSTNPGMSMNLAGVPPGSGPSTYPQPTPPSTQYPALQTAAFFDTGIYNNLDIWVACNNPDFGNAVQTVDYILESMSPVPSMTLPDSAVIPI